MKAHQQPAAILALVLLPLLAAAAPRKPAAFTLELLAPATDVLGGQVEVRVAMLPLPSLTAAPPPSCSLAVCWESQGCAAIFVRHEPETVGSVARGLNPPAERSRVDEGEARAVRVSPKAGD